MDFTTKEIAHKIAAAACDKKAKDILLLNMENISPVTDYFIIASAGNNILVKAIADNIEDKLAEAGIFVTHKEGYKHLAVTTVLNTTIAAIIAIIFAMIGIQ